MFIRFMHFYRYCEIKRASTCLFVVPLFATWFAQQILIVKDKLIINNRNIIYSKINNFKSLNNL